MNPVVIVLGIIVILLIYFIYVTYYSSQTIFSKLDLNTTPSSSIAADDLMSKTSPSYAYGLWFFFNANPASSNVDLLKYSGDSGAIIGANKGKLETIFGGSTTTILNTVPVQRWTHVIISVDRNLLDIYIDGKLYKSSIMATPPQLAPAALLIGPGTKIDAYLSKVKRWGSAMDPNTAWKTYTEGTGIINSPVNYNIEMTMSENSQVTSKYSLF